MYLSALMLLLSLTDRAVVSSLRFYFTFKFSEASNGATTLSLATFIVTTLSMTFNIKTLILLANACHYGMLSVAIRPFAECRILSVIMQNVIISVV